MMAVLSASAGAQRQKPPLLLAAYEQPDGAITVFPDGRFVEPYFAMRALLTAKHLGLESDAVARKWIAWQLERLERDSTFRRYCRTPGSPWTSCGSVDADDAALALWIELLYETAGVERLPAAWRRSAVQAEAKLAALFDARRGVYVISRALPVSLFMDNVEIRAALESVARHHDRAGRRADATAARTRASALRRAIDSVFWNKGSRQYAVSTQPPAGPSAFYPDVVAQVFPAVFGYGSPRMSSSGLVSVWMAQHGRAWIDASDQEYPWGLVAMAALRAGDRASAICWLGAATFRRHGARWNVLEEVVFQAMSDSLGIGGAAPPCAAVWIRDDSRGLRASPNNPQTP
jgi:hypothetical protein